MKTQSLKHFLLLIMLVASNFVALAADEVLNNDSILELQKIGLGESTIVEKIKTSKCNFDTSIEALKQLKAANVPENVIQAMLAGTGTASAGAETKVAVASDANDPAANHELGVWLFQSSGGTNLMTELEPAIFNQMRSGSGWAMGWGASMHMRVALNGPNAKLQITDHKPVFYFYFGEGALNGATSPAEFTLVKTEIKKDKNEETRLLVTGKVNAYSGTSMGFDQKSVVPFDFDKIGKGIYKVTPKTDLAGGEYCFCQGSFAEGAAGKVYDFGVAAGK